MASVWTPCSRAGQTSLLAPLYPLPLKTFTSIGFTVYYTGAFGTNISTRFTTSLVLQLAWPLNMLTRWKHFFLDLEQCLDLSFASITFLACTSSYSSAFSKQLNTTAPTNTHGPLPNGCLAGPGRSFTISTTRPSYVLVFTYDFNIGYLFRVFFGFFGLFGPPISVVFFLAIPLFACSFDFVLKLLTPSSLFLNSLEIMRLALVFGIEFLALMPSTENA